MAGDKPNIVFIQTDQLQPGVLRAYGDKVCQSPHIDRLAAQGVVFERAYCNFPLCAPSRFSMASGQLASRIGAFDNGAEFASEIPTYAHYLRAAGYQTCLSGKMHFVGADQLHGFEERLTTDIYPSDFLWSPDWTSSTQRDVTDTRAITQSGICARSVQIDYDEEAAFKAVQKIYDLARSDDERPFFLHVSFTHPHDPYLCTRAHWDRYEGIDIPPPATPTLPLEEHDPHARRILGQIGLDKSPVSPADTARARRAYYGSVSYIDDQVGALMHALAKAGFADNTVVVFSSDHGEMLGERGLWLKKCFYEASLRIPLIIHAPGRLEPGRVETLVSLLDLLPTFAGLAAGGDVFSPVEPLDGTDLAAIMRQPDLDRTIHAEHLADSVFAPVYMIRRGHWKFIGSNGDPDMLYDLDSDPHERVNLATDPAHAETAAAFRAEMTQKWDDAAITAAILKSQKRRHFIMKAMASGQRTSWDFDEEAGDDVPWFRGQRGYNDWAFDFLRDPHEV